MLHSVSCKNGIYYKLCKPDGGWGYMICLAFIIVVSEIELQTMIVGLIFKDFLKQINDGSTAAGIQSGIYTICFAISAYASTIISKRYSYRKSGLLGAFLLTLGSFIGIFTDSTFTFIISYGFFVGLGIGTILNIIYAAMNTYFEERRQLTMSICQTVIGAINMIWPLVIYASLESFGFRGALILMCGLTMQSILAFVMVQPIEKHYKLVMMSKDEVNDYEEKSLLKDDKTCFNEPQNEIGDNKLSCLRRIISFLNLQQFSDLIFCNIALGQALTIFGDFTMHMLLSLYLYEENWSPRNITMAVTVSNTGNMFARIILVYLNKFSLQTRTIIYYAAVMDVVVRLFIPYVNSLACILTLALVQGFTRGVRATWGPLLLAEYLPVDKYVSGHGLMIFMAGFFGLFAGPIIGAVRDSTSNYTTSFHFVSLMLLIGGLIPWTVELFNQNLKRNSEDRWKLNRLFY